MARERFGPLDAGDDFPRIEFDTIDGDKLALPGHFQGRWGVFLVYRGHW